MSSIHISTLRIITADLDAELSLFDKELSLFEEELSSMEHREIPIVSGKLDATNTVETDPSVTRKSKRHDEKKIAIELPKRLPENQNEIKADQTEHFKQFEKNFHFISLWGKPIGLKMDYEWKKNNPRYCLLNILTLFGWSQFFYTKYLHISNGNFAKVLEVFAIYGTGLAIIATDVVNFISYKEITALLNFTRKICLQNVSGSRADVLKSRLTKIYKLLIIVCVGGFFCINVFVGYPIKAFLMDGRSVPIMPIQIMFVNQSTTSGFLIANGIMAIFGLWTLWLLLFFNLSLLNTIANYSIQVDLIEEDVKELNGYWSGVAPPFKGYQHILLRNICQKQQDMNSYLNKVKDIYDDYIFVFFVFSYVSQIICMFQIVSNGWISGYGIALGVFMCQAAYCCVGTIISVENDRMYNVLLQFEWYNCDLRSQKIYLQLLTSSMDCKELWIGPLAPLSVFTGAQIIKSMYGYYTVMLESV